MSSPLVDDWFLLRVRLLFCWQIPAVAHFLSELQRHSRNVTNQKWGVLTFKVKAAFLEMCFQW